jgi:N-ethylmaleimide reductase
LLTTYEIRDLAGQYAKAARNVIAVGCDGIELYSANGYLLQQFLWSNVNQRTDPYGGSIENRVRMPLEMLAAITAEAGANKTGIRVSPGHTFNDLVENDVPELCADYLERL